MLTANFISGTSGHRGNAQSSLCHYRPGVVRGGRWLAGDYALRMSVSPMGTLLMPPRSAEAKATEHR